MPKYLTVHLFEGGGGRRRREEEEGGEEEGEEGGEEEEERQFCHLCSGDRCVLMLRFQPLIQNHTLSSPAVLSFSYLVICLLTT